MTDKEWGQQAAEWVKAKEQQDAQRLEHENNCLRVRREQSLKLCSSLIRWITQQIELFNSNSTTVTLEYSQDSPGFTVFANTLVPQRKLAIKRDSDAILYKIVKGSNESQYYSLTTTVTSDWQLVFADLQGRQQTISEVGGKLLNELIDRPR